MSSIRQPFTEVGTALAELQKTESTNGFEFSWPLPWSPELDTAH
jgi:hypothetical protein